jgi:hypothetical protein
MGSEYNGEWDQKEITYTLTYKDVVDILQTIDHSECRELHLEVGDLKLTVVKKQPGISGKKPSW